MPVQQMLNVPPISVWMVFVVTVRAVAPVKAALKIIPGRPTVFAVLF